MNTRIMSFCTFLTAGILAVACAQANRPAASQTTKTDQPKRQSKQQAREAPAPSSSTTADGQQRPATAPESPQPTAKEQPLQQTQTVHTAPSGPGRQPSLKEELDQLKGELGKALSDFREMTRQLQELSNRVSKVQEQVQGLAGKVVVRDDFQKLQRDVAASKKRLDTLADKFGNYVEHKTQGLIARVGVLEATVRPSGEKDGLLARVGVLENVVRQVTEPVLGSEDVHILRILGQMEIKPFREQFRAAVVEVTRGELWIRNDTSKEWTVYVNGRPERIDAGENVPIDVPIGPVTTELWPYERPKVWILDKSNDYKQQIRIYARTVSAAGPPAKGPFSEPPGN